MTTDSPAATMVMRLSAVRSMAGPGKGDNHDRGVADPVRGLLLVADGMGGLPMAEAVADRASALVAGFLGADSDGPALLAAVKAAGTAVGRMARSAGVKRAGTTLCVGLIHGSQLLVANLGDSRCYLVRAGIATKLTVDHTAAARLIAAGTIEDGSPAAADLERTLERYVGRDGSGPDLETHELQPGDRLLFCTDGVHRSLSHDVITEMLVCARRPGEVADLLVGAAKAAGGTDDATAVVADIGFRPAKAVSITSEVGGMLLAAGEAVTVGRAGQGADLGFADAAVHARAARVSANERGWTLENTGRKLVAVVRDRRSPMQIDVASFRSLAVPFADAEVVFTTHQGEHRFMVECPSVIDSGVVVPSMAPTGTGDAYPFDKNSAQFRTLIAVCEPLLRRQRWGRRLTDKSIRRRLLAVEPDVTVKAVSRRIDELGEKILGSSLRDLRGLAEKAVVTGTVTLEDLHLIKDAQ